MSNKRNVPDFPILRSEIVEELRKVYKDLRDCEKRLCKLVDQKDKDELHCIGYVLSGLLEARYKISDINSVI